MSRSIYFYSTALGFWIQEGRYLKLEFWSRLSTLQWTVNIKYSTQGARFLSSRISKPWSKPQTCKTTNSESLVFGRESRWLSCWWQPLSLLSGFPLLWDKIYDYGEGWWERNPPRLSLVYLDFCFSAASLPLLDTSGWPWQECGLLL